MKGLKFLLVFLLILTPLVLKPGVATYCDTNKKVALCSGTAYWWCALCIPGVTPCGALCTSASEWAFAQCKITCWGLYASFDNYCSCCGWNGNKASCGDGVCNCNEPRGTSSDRINWNVCPSDCGIDLFQPCGTGIGECSNSTVSDGVYSETYYCVDPDVSGTDVLNSPHCCPDDEQIWCTWRQNYQGGACKFPVGHACTKDSDCCSNFCLKEPGAAYGVCSCGSYAQGEEVCETLSAS